MNKSSNNYIGSVNQTDILGGSATALPVKDKAQIKGLTYSQTQNKLYFFVRTGSNHSLYTQTFNLNGFQFNPPRYLNDWVFNDNLHYMNTITPIDVVTDQTGQFMFVLESTRILTFLLNGNDEPVLWKVTNLSSNCQNLLGIDLQF